MCFYKKYIYCIIQMVNAPELFVNVSSSIKNILCATGNLNTSIEAFAAVAQKLEKKCKELEEKEKFLKEMEKSLLRGHGELEKKEIEYRKREKELLRRENEVTQREVEAERKKSENFSHYGENITLNVGMYLILYFIFTYSPPSL